VYLFNVYSNNPDELRKAKTSKKKPELAKLPENVKIQNSIKTVDSKVRTNQNTLTKNSKK